jgi:trans-aconitate methyltransferase
MLSKITFDSVSELGCGTGKNTEWLVQKATQVVAVDFPKEC